MLFINIFVKENEFLELAVNQIGREQTKKYQKQLVDSLDWQYRMGHYDKKEATILVNAVYKKITTLPSYLDWSRSRSKK